MNVLQLANEEFLPHVCELVSEGHQVTITAKGYSMRPFVESERDKAVLAKADAYAQYDVVLAEIAKGHYVLHRIDRICSPDGKRLKGKVSDPQALVVLRGDGNVRGTESCRLCDIRAITTHFIRKGKPCSTNSRFWRCYSRIWRFCLPVRRYLLALYRLFWRGELPQRFKKSRQ